MANLESEGIRKGFTERFALALKNAGITGSIQAKADRLEVSKSFMAALLRGEKLPAREMSLRIAEKCGVRESWLMAGELPMRKDTTPNLPIDHWGAEDQEVILGVWKAINSKYI